MNYKQRKRAMQREFIMVFRNTGLQTSKNTDTELLNDVEIAFGIRIKIIHISWL